MMNRYPLWKHLLILIVLVAAAIYALPNIYGEDPALQISATRSAVVDQALKERVDRQLQQSGLAVKSDSLLPTGLLIRFNQTEDQLKAKDILTDQLGQNYIVALNLAPATPAWLQAINALPMYLGLDLRGGVHFLMEVDVDGAVKQADERYMGDFRAVMREEKIRYQGIEHASNAEFGGVEVKFEEAAVRDQAASAILKQFPELQIEKTERDGVYLLHGFMSVRARHDLRDMALHQNITTLNNRVNQLGVAEPVIQRQGDSRIVVQLPGVQDTARAKEILGATATLEFRLVDETANAQDAVQGRVPPGDKLYYERGGQPVVLKNRVMLTGDYIVDAGSGFDPESGGSMVNVTLDGKGASIFSNATKDNVGKPMAVVFIETKSETRMVDGQAVKTKKKIEEVINVAVIREQLSKRFQISGLDSPKEARDLALLLRAGALAAPMDIVEERTVGPSLGKENIQKGFYSCLIGLALVTVFMIWRYKLFGVFASFAQVFNLVIIIAILSLMQATLTLPGIAGIVLTVGMAVDANVLINERIREELLNGNSPLAAIEAGYERALGTIADSNITTLIAGLMLFALGSGPVKGFAVVLCIGILTSMFTALMGTRSLVYLIYGGKRRVNSLSV